MSTSNDKDLIIQSPNLCKDTAFRRKVIGPGQHGSSDEALAIVDHALNNCDTKKDNKGVDISDERGQVRILRLGAESNESDTACCGDRADLEIKAKLFLKDTNTKMAQYAFEYLLKILDSEYVDSLQLAVPESSLSFLGIASEPRPKNEEYNTHLGSFIKLYNEFERRVDKGQLRSIGLCDVEEETLKRLFEAAHHRPRTITINLNACCAIPDDLRDFAKAQSVELKTHSDAEIMLEQSNLDKFDFTMEWIVRFQVMDRSRGVIQDKRYVIALKRN